jgi:hypothetical protein
MMPSATPAPMPVKNAHSLRMLKSLSNWSHT